MKKPYSNQNNLKEIATPSPWADLFYSKNLIEPGEFENKVSSYLLRGKPGAVFDAHTHPHSQILYFLAGHGTGFVGTTTYTAEPGTIVIADGGEEHSLRNTSLDDLEVLIINIPAAPA